jgi:hypothetical protein
MDVEISPTEDSNSGDSFGHLSELPSLLFFLYCILFPVPTIVVENLGPGHKVFLHVG